MCIYILYMSQTQDNFTGMKFYVSHKITRAKITPHPANITLNKQEPSAHYSLIRRSTTPMRINTAMFSRLSTKRHQMGSTTTAGLVEELSSDLLGLPGPAGREGRRMVSQIRHVS